MAERKRKLSPEHARVDALVRAKDANKLLLLSKPHVIGLDVGFRVKGGEVTNEQVVKVYVSRKLGKSELAKEDLIPARLKIDDKEVGVDVEEGSIDQPYAFTLRSRPLRGGSSIGPATPPLVTGTLGVCVTLNDGNTYILSNNHVIAASNQAQAGANIVQPSLGDNGNAANDVVATLSDFVPLEFGTTTIRKFGLSFDIPNRNYVDAAIAQVNNGYNDGNREIHWVGYPTFLRSDGWGFWKKISLFGRRVCKMGRTTEFTVGRITSLWYDTWVGPYPVAGNQNAYFENQIRIQGEGGPFARPGDSGSLVLDFETREPIGLLFSGGGNYANANPLDEVLDRLAIPQL